MQGTKGSSANNYRGFITCMGFNKWNDFFKNIIIELLVSYNFNFRLYMMVHPAFIVDAVNRKDLHLAIIYKVCNGIYQLKPLILQVIRRRCWYQQ